MCDIFYLDHGVWVDQRVLPWPTLNTTSVGVVTFKSNILLSYYCNINVMRYSYLLLFYQVTSNILYNILAIFCM